MTTKFAYVPFAPESLSGPAFISQTERAFNELGSAMDAANTTAAQALGKAGSALATAAEALSTADNALSSAEDAGGSAAGALSAAKTAQNSADAANACADSAYDLAASAMTTAETGSAAAQTTANKALATAETARTTAEGIRDTAGQALSTAEDALSLAGVANGSFRIVTAPEEMDAGEYTIPDKVFFEGTAPVAGLPAGHEAKGGYLKVYAAESENGDSRILQIFYSTDGRAVFRREGRFAAGEVEEEILTWGRWASLPDTVVTTGDDGKIPAGALPADLARLSQVPALSDSVSSASSATAASSKAVKTAYDVATAARNAASAALPTSGTAAAAAKLAAARTIDGVAFDGAKDITLPNGITRILTGATTVYAAPASKGTGDGSTAANAMELQALLTAMESWNFNGRGANVTLASGTYSGSYVVNARYYTNATNIILNGAGVDATVFSSGSGNAVAVYGSGSGSAGNTILYVNNCTFSLSGGYGLYSQYGASSYVNGNVKFKITGAVSACVYAGEWAKTTINGSSSESLSIALDCVSGFAPTYFLHCSQFSYVYVRYADFAITGTPAMTAFIYREGPGRIYWGSVTNTGDVSAATDKIVYATASAYGYQFNSASIPGKRGETSNLPVAALNSSQTANQVLRTNAVNAEPVWGAVNLPTDVTGTLATANGGTGNTTGNAATATKLASARTISLTGAVTGSATFDGSANASIATSLGTTGGAAPKPQTAAGGGQWVPVGNGKLPSGGTWAYFTYTFPVGSEGSPTPAESKAGVAAGGTVVGGDGLGFAWRIA